MGLKCTFPTRTNGETSQLYEKLKELTKNEILSELEYARITSPEFKEWFADFDWVKNWQDPNDNIPLGENHLDENYEPLLQKDKTGWYFKNTKQEKSYISVSKLSDFTSEEVEQIVNEVSYFMMDDILAEGGDIRTEISKIKGGIYKYVINYAKELQEDFDGDSVAQERIKLLFDNAHDLADTIKLLFKQKSIDLVEKEITETGKGSGLNIAESSSVNSKDRATANIKLMLSFIPKLDSDFEIVPSDYLGGPTFESFDVIWNLIETTLADKTTLIIKDAQGNDVLVSLYDQFISALKEKQNLFPSLQSVLEELNEKNDHVKAQFVQAFHKQKLNFTSSINEGSTYKITTTDQNSIGQTIAANWTESLFRDSEIIDASNQTIRKSKSGVAMNELVLNTYRNLVLDINKHQEIRTGDIARIYNALDLVGIRLTPGVLESMINERAKEVALSKEKEEELSAESIWKEKQLIAYKRLLGGNTNSLLNLFKALGNANSKDLFTIEGDVNPFKTERIFMELADAEGTRNPDATETTTVTPGGLVWLYDLPSFLSTNVQMFKEGEVTELEARSQKAYYRNSRWIKQILAGNTNNIQLLTFNSYRKKGDTNSVKDNNDITFEEQFVDSLVKIEQSNPILNMLEPADKGRFIQIQGFDLMDISLIDVAGKTSLIKGGKNTAIVDRFYDYFLDEYNRIVESQKNSEDTSRVDKYNKNASKFSFFDFLYEHPEVIQSFDKGDGNYFDTVKGDVALQIKQLILANLQKRVEQGIDTAKNARIEAGIPSELIKQLGSKSNNPFGYLVGKFVINGMIANIEMTKLFTGDPAYYKNLTDFKKRVPATYTNGIHLSIDNLEDRYFNAAVLKTHEYASEFLFNENPEKRKQYIKAVAAATGASESKVKSILSDYDSVDRTDAQAYISPRRWAFLMEKMGKGPEASRVMKNISEDNLTTEDLKIIAQPLKGVYFSVENGKPTYLKYSQAVLMPNLVRGTQLETLAEAMENGKEKIDEVIFDSGVKVGAQDSNSIQNESGDIVITEPLKSFRLDNRFWKLQQDLPSKGIKDTDVGSQIQKNILADFDMEGSYTYDGETITGRELYQVIDNAFTELSNQGADKIKKKFLDDRGKVKPEAVRNSILQEASRNGQDENLLGALNKGIPYDSIPAYKNKIQSMVYNPITKKTVKLKTSGGALIQMSNFGLDRLTPSERAGITWLTDPDKLKPPMIVDGKLKPGEVLMPHSIIAKLIPNYKELSLAQLKRKIDPRLFEAVGYRIPNQGMSSNDALDIVGILPPEMGDTIVAYSEITAKTGSDFDIDKMFVMLPAINPIYSDDAETMRQFLKHDGGRTSIIARIFNEQDLTTITTTNHVEKMKQVGEALAKLKKEGTDNSDLQDVLDDFDNFISENPKYIKRLGYTHHNGTSEHSLQNRIIHAYRSILTDTKSYLALTTSIDKTTQLISRDILINELPLKVANAVREFDSSKVKTSNEILDSAETEGLIEFNSDKTKITILSTKDGFAHIDPIQELLTKKGLSEGKNGVGTTANHLVDHVISQTIPLALTEDIGLGHSDANGTRFSEMYDSNGATKGQKITDVISAFLNAFVDIAKDPYILRGNYTNFTTGSAFFLLRAGVPYKTVNRIMRQPVLVKYNEYNNIKSSSVSSPFTKERTDSKGDKYTTTVNIKNKIVEETKIESPNASIISEMSLREIAEEYLTEENLEEAIETGDPDTQYAVLSYYNKIQDHVDALQDINAATKSDVKGATSNAATRQGFENLMKKALANKNFTGFRERFNDRFGTFYNNSVALAGEISKDIFLEETIGMKSLKNIILTNLGKENSTSEEVLKTLSEELYAFVMSTTEFRSGDIGALISALPNRVLEMKKKLNNPFLDTLVTERVGKHVFIRTNSVRNKSDFQKNSLYKGWVDLLTSKEDNERQLGEELIKYAYYTSGFKTGIGRFFDSIPHDWVGWNNVDFNIKNKIQEFNTNDFALSDASIEIFFDQFVQHNYENNKLVPLVPKGKPFLKFNTTQVMELDLQKVSKDQIIGTSESGVVVYPHYVKTKAKVYGENNEVLGENTLLWKQVGMSKDHSPIYARLNTKGFKARGHRITEYTNTLSPSIFADNNKQNIKHEKLYSHPDIYPTPSVQSPYGLEIREKTGENIWNSEENVVPSQTMVEIEVVSRYTNADVKANPDKIYVFGDNNKRTGTGGQAQIRNNENAFGISTKLAPNNTAAAFMSDNSLQENKDVIDSDIAAIKEDGRQIVFPKDGFGTGLAKLKVKAPQTYSYLKQRLQVEFGFNNDTGEVSTQKTGENVVSSQEEISIKDVKVDVEVGPEGSIISFNDKKGKYAGHISYDNTTGMLTQIQETFLREDLRGKGIGKMMYKLAGEYIAKQGLVFTSHIDNSRSSDANRVWESLVREELAHRDGNLYKYGKSDKHMSEETENMVNDFIDLSSNPFSVDIDAMISDEEANERNNECG